jgi:hypothetical protein
VTSGRSGLQQQAGCLLAASAPPRPALAPAPASLEQQLVCNVSALAFIASGPLVCILATAAAAAPQQQVPALLSGPSHSPAPPPSVGFKEPHKAAFVLLLLSPTLS